MSDERLTELLLRWEELRERGETPSPEELCRDHPELLAAFREAIGGLVDLDDLLGTRVGKAGDVPPPPIDWQPVATTRYRSLALHAGGGLGDVFLAEDIELNRQVALKQMKPHLVQQADLRRRFLMEAEVTGRLEHPGIVPVYGLGLDDQGRPYYAMRFIRGKSLHGAITEYHQSPAEGRALKLAELLASFIAVCNAVAYAHSRGILHRDLKPANILIGPYGETLVVDWGLARPVERVAGESGDGEETLRPESRPDATYGVVGTPAYMAPEQAARAHSLVGPASDVYSLGATLYHLLTGQAPFERGEVGELLLKVQRGAFAPPRALRADVPRPLEAICLKAMALECADRYASPLALAGDLKAYLADEPVAAWREPLGERARRWVKRRRTAVLATAAAAAVALVALAVSTVLLNRARQDERDARGEAEQSAARERGEFERAERMYHLAQQGSGTLLALGAELKPTTEAEARRTEKALQEVNRLNDQLRERGGDRPELLAGKARVLTSLAEVYITLGDTEASRTSASEAVRLYQQLGEARDRAGEAAAREQLGQALLFQGKLEQGAVEHRAALALRRQLAKSFPKEPLYIAQQARSHNFIGNVLRVRGHDRAAEVEYHTALRLSRQAASAPGLTYARARLAASLEKVADSLYAREDLPGAAARYEEALKEVTALLREAVGGGSESGPVMALVQQQTTLRLSLGWGYLYLGEPARARPLFAQALADSGRFSELDPSNREWQRLAMQARAYSANVRQGGDGQKEAREMLAFWRLSRQTSRERAARDPRNVEWASQAASTAALLGQGLLGVPDPEQIKANFAEPERLVNEAIAELERLHRAVPDHLPIAESLGRAFFFSKLVAQVRGQPDVARDRALQWARHLEQFYRRGLAGGQDAPVWKGRLADTKRRLAETLGGMNQDLPAALRSAEEAIALYEQLHEAEPAFAPWLRDLAMAHAAARRSLLILAPDRARQRHPKDADAQYRDWLKGPERIASNHHLHRARDAWERLIALQPGVVRWRTELAECYRELAEQRRLQRDPAGEERYYHKYLDTLEALARAFPAEAARDPFIDPGATTTGDVIARGSFKLDAKMRAQALAQSEQMYWSTRRPRLGVELAERYIGLVHAADISEPAQARQVRWAVRRGLSVLRGLQAAKKLHAVHARMIPFYEARLRALGVPAEAAELPAAWRRPWTELDFAALARLAQEGKRVAELVGVLDKLLADSAGIPWLRWGVRERMLQELLRVEGLAEAVAAEAAKQSDKLSPAGRELFAQLARALRKSAEK